MPSIVVASGPSPLQSSVGCDLTISNSLSPSSVLSGHSATVTLFVENVGQTTCGLGVALPTTVTDDLPSGMTATSVAPPPGWSCPITNSGATVICKTSNAGSSTIPPNTPITITISVTVIGSPGTLVNYATISNMESVPQTNQSRATITITTIGEPGGGSTVCKEFSCATVNLEITFAWAPQYYGAGGGCGGSGGTICQVYASVNIAYELPGCSQMDVQQTEVPVPASGPATVLVEGPDSVGGCSSAISYNVANCFSTGGEEACTNSGQPLFTCGKSDVFDIYDCGAGPGFNAGPDTGTTSTSALSYASKGWPSCNAGTSSCVGGWVPSCVGAPSGVAYPDGGEPIGTGTFNVPVKFTYATCPGSPNNVGPNNVGTGSWWATGNGEANWDWTLLTPTLRYTNCFSPATCSTQEVGVAGQLEVGTLNLTSSSSVVTAINGTAAQAAANATGKGYAVSHSIIPLTVSQTATNVSIQLSTLLPKGTYSWSAQSSNFTLTPASGTFTIIPGQSVSITGASSPPAPVPEFPPYMELLPLITALTITMLAVISMRKSSSRKHVSSLPRYFWKSQVRK